MRRFGFAIALFCLLLAGCAPALTATSAVTDLPTPVFSPSPSATFAPTNTLAPTLTAMPAPPTVTPLPISGCPQENPDLIPDFPYCTPDGSCEAASYIRPILEFLNSGGTQKAILQAFDKGRNIIPNEYILSAELTGDKNPEFIYSDFEKGLVIFGCRNGQYEIMLETGNPQYGVISTQDLNSDESPELTVADQYGLRIYDWDGSRFNPNLLYFYDGSTNDVVYVDGLWTYAFVRSAQAYLIKLQSGTPSPSAFRIDGINYIPYRRYKLTISWDGEKFSVSYPEYTPPEYRFQAVQDADIAVLEQKYDVAVDLYQQAIFSDKLGWWSLERRNYLFYLEVTKYDLGLSQSVVEPSQDNTDYRQLAAYAYYRMVILHTFLGEMEAAQVKYATLQEKFPAGNPGHPYVELATDFWNAYQSSVKMYNACAAAIAYADAHPEILTPLGSDYHGAQSHTYLPADVCPLR